MGGGVGISRLGEFRIATERAMFAMPETGNAIADASTSTYIHMFITDDCSHWSVSGRGKLILASAIIRWAGRVYWLNWCETRRSRLDYLRNSYPLCTQVSRAINDGYTPLAKTKL